MQHAQCGVIYFTTSATSWVCRTRQCTGMAIAALKSQLGSCLVRQIAQKKGKKKGKSACGHLHRPRSSWGCRGGLSMITQRLSRICYLFCSRVRSYWILLARSICVKVKLECRLNMGTVRAYWGFREVANTTKVHFQPKFNNTT